MFRLHYDLVGLLLCMQPVVDLKVVMLCRTVLKKRMLKVLLTQGSTEKLLSGVWGCHLTESLHALW